MYEWHAYDYIHLRICKCKVFSFDHGVLLTFNKSMNRQEFVFSHMSRAMTKPTKRLCVQRKLRSAWASAQSDQSPRCPHEETLGSYLPTERTAKTLIKLGGCPG